MRNARCLAKSFPRNKKKIPHANNRRTVQRHDNAWYVYYNLSEPGQVGSFSEGCAKFLTFRCNSNSSCRKLSTKSQRDIHLRKIHFSYALNFTHSDVTGHRTCIDVHERYFSILSQRISRVSSGRQFNLVGDVVRVSDGILHRVGF